MESDIHEHMLSKLKMQWKKNASQDLFILAGILNPYVHCTCFSCAVLSDQDIIDLTVWMLTQLFQYEPLSLFKDVIKDYIYWQNQYLEEKMKLNVHLSYAKNKVSIKAKHRYESIYKLNWSAMGANL